MATHLYSFGWKHGTHKLIPDRPAPLILDVMTLGFTRNPWLNPLLRSLPGQHWKVEIDIQKTRDFDRKLQELRNRVASYMGPVYIGCHGGQHRSVYLADRIGRELGIATTHLDLGKSASVQPL